MKKALVIVAVVVAVLAIAGLALFFTGALGDPFGGGIGRDAAAAKAADYVATEFPQMASAPQLANENDALPYWEYGYRTDTQEEIDGEQVTVTQIVIVRVDKETGEVSAFVSN